jgi:two-component system sensor kinase FixL
MNDTTRPDDSHVPTVSEARLSSVLDTAADGIVVIDDRGRILVFNSACERLFGYRAAEVIGENVMLLMPGRYADEHGSYIGNYQRTGVRKIIGIGREVQGRRKDGAVFPMELSVGEAPTPDGRQYIGIIRDVTARKDAERRFNELQADLVHMARVSALDEMGAALAHELNQPLTAIMLYLQAAQRAAERDGSAMSGATRDILGKVLREAERAGAIIQRMRSFVEKKEPERKAADLGRLADEAVELTLLGQRGHIRVVRRHAADLAPVPVDAVQIQQVIVNVVRNAIQAVRRQPNAEIVVGARQENGAVVLSVSDNGPGIPRDVLPTLFKAFHSSKKRGLGLGLAISKTIAQNHGGDLVVDPGGEGRGATFSLVLPLPATPARPRRTNGGGSEG